MNLKVLICIGFSGLLGFATGSSEKALNQKSIKNDDKQSEDVHLAQENFLDSEPAQSDGPQKETQTTSNGDILNGRIGELEISRDTSARLDIIWTINDFFTLPYQPDSGITSPDFSSLGFKGFFVMDPKGSAITPGDLQFRSVIFRHDVRRGKIHFKLFLKMLNGTLMEFAVKSPFDNFFTSDIPKLKILEEKDILAPGGFLTVLFRLSKTGKFVDNFERGSEDAPNSNSINNAAEKPDEDGQKPLGSKPKQSGTQKDVPLNPTDASSSAQLTTDGRVGDLQLSADTPESVDVIWKIPNFLTLPYRTDAGIISPDLDSLGFKGYFVMDPKGSANTFGMMSINSFISHRDRYRDTFLRVFLKANDDILKAYATSVSVRNYFNCYVSKIDIIGDKESMVPGGVLTVLFKLRLMKIRSNGNPEQTPNFGSMHDVGDLDGRGISSSKFAITWKFQDFFSLPEYRQLTGFLPRLSPYVFAHIYLTPKGIYDEAGFTRLKLHWRYKRDVPAEKLVPYPTFSCKFSLKTRENTLYNITGEQYSLRRLGGYCYCLIPWSEVYERKDFLVPRGELELILNMDLGIKDVELEAQTESSTLKDKFAWTTELPYTTEKEAKTTSDRDILSRIGELEISRDTSASLDIIWTINDFFTLPYQPDRGIISPDFNSLGFKGFFVMDPRGSAMTPGDLQFRSVIFRHDVRRGKIYYKLFLKMLNGTFMEFAVKSPFDNFFTSDISKLKIIEEKDILAPGGVLTVLFRLSTTGKFADNLKGNCDCKSDKKEPEDCDSKISHLVTMSSDFLELYKTGVHSDATLKCGDEEFAVHKSILTARSSVFADMFKRHADENGKNIEEAITLTDVECSILDLFLKYIYSSRVDYVTKDEKQQVVEAAQKYGVRVSLSRTTACFIF